MWTNLLKAAHHIVNLEKIPDKGLFYIYFHLRFIHDFDVDFDRDSFYVVMFEDLVKNVEHLRQHSTTLGIVLFYFFFYLLNLVFMQQILKLLFRLC